MDIEVAKDKGSYPKITVTVSDLKPAFWMKNFKFFECKSSDLFIFGAIARCKCVLLDSSRRYLPVAKTIPQSRAIERGNSPSANQMHRTHTHRTSHSEFQKYTAKCVGFSPEVFKPVWKAAFVKVRVSIGFQLYKPCNCLLSWAIARCKSYVQRLTTTDVCHEMK